jgi:hypothetical protein
MKININNLDLDEFEDDPLPDREKFKRKPKVSNKKVLDRKESTKDQSDIYTQKDEE